MKSKGKIVNGLRHPSQKMAYAKAGFTIIELLTVMSIIVILLSLLIPSLNMVRWYAKFVTQKNQLRNIDAGLQAFSIDFQEYPDSGAMDSTGLVRYCGAMKLAEAMAGQDGLGFNPDSLFKANGQDASGNELYPPPNDPGFLDNLRSRKEFLEAKDVQISSLSDLYGSNIGSFSFPDKVALLCDVYKRPNMRRPGTGEKLGMPILYYKADPSKLLHDVNTPDNPDNIYNYKDNHEFLGLGLPWDTTTRPPLYQGSSGPPGQVFYQKTLDKSALPITRPHNKDTYILISAGRDNIYGTRDDVFNFAE
jgi:prepilin-type N-terminal cleavage/methylation domain-containing protein